MSKEKITDQEIADGIFEEMKLSMKRVEDAHSDASKDGELKRDAYSCMKDEGLWDAKTIISEYLVIKEKKSVLPANLRQMIILLFEVASTNFWAKQAKKAMDEQDAKGNKKRGKRQS